MYAEGDERYGIEKDRPFGGETCQACCDIYLSYPEDDPNFLEPPCHICPQAGFELTTNNQWTWEHWQCLNRTGRSRTMGHEYLREEAITLHLKRYARDTPLWYEKLLVIEDRMVEHHYDQKESKRKQAERKRKPSKR